MFLDFGSDFLISPLEIRSLEGKWGLFLLWGLSGTGS